MRIHSKFGDYYDSALAYGIDESLHYARHTEEMKSKEIEDLCKAAKVETFRGWRYKPEHDLVRGTTLIGHSGKFSYGVQVQDHRKDPRDAFPPSTFQWCWDIDHLDKHFAKNKKQDAEYRKKVRYYFTKREESFRDTMKRRFEMDFASDPNLSELFVKHSTPLIRLYDGELILNPELKPLGFARKVDPFTMFQEISMFMGGVLCNIEDPDPSNVGDPYLMYQKGFDDYSFKKLPKKKR